MEINIAELVAPSFDNDIQDILDHKYTEYAENGGRGSTKSSAISVACILLMIQNPDINGLVLRKVGDTLADSVYEQLLWAIESLHQEDDFIPKLSPLRIVRKSTGQVIIFRGADKPKKIKSIKLKKGYFGFTWFEETDEFTPNDIQTIKLSTMRGGSKYWIFYSYNPPSSVRNWVNVEFNRYKPGRLVHKTDYLSVPREWLGEAFYEEAEDMKLNNPRAYANVFLGEATGTGRNIFENVELREITEEEIDSFDWLYYGIDFGYFPDPFIWNEFSYDSKTKTLYIIDELKLHKHRNEEASKKLEEYLAQKWKRKAERLKNPKLANYDFKNDRIICDSAEPKSIADWSFYGWNVFGCKKFPHSLEAGMKWLQGLNKIVIDPKRCPEASDEFSLYEYALDKKSGEILEGFPDGQPDHAIASARYGLEDIWQRKGM